MRILALACTDNTCLSLTLTGSLNATAALALDRMKVNSGTSFLTLILTLISSAGWGYISPQCFSIALYIRVIYEDLLIF